MNQSVASDQDAQPSRARVRAMLLSIRREIEGHLRAQREGARRGPEERPATDDGQMLPTDEALQQHVAFAVMEASSEALARIDQALRRLDEGRYGRCSECGDAIALRRLRALPFAVRCLDCEQSRETASRPEKPCALVNDPTMPSSYSEGASVSTMLTRAVPIHLSTR